MEVYQEYTDMTTESEDMSLEKALEVIKQIAERHERDMAACAMAGRIERERRNALQAAQAAGSESGRAEVV
ncbi:MAG: hypothetical protein EOM80_18110 [Erysipelotrichia bacterium]|nr:hypothetical protein [Erysipelotrichia bacterium]